ncbi:preprotein translocase subunit SecY [Pediococcus acidilactici]|jgi:preprotein translocase subunit SecY|uniref:preprotein translocase subunit SecY n=1 Tax=Pediococcus acidilactici TaxID=1254 RepID=UPI0006B68044|nr:preprotein translocase subunit SecY [Pediococcus acidilactici]KAF0372029.1 preprotein translocase subunit SecY [Pediococcus acidilactici]KAF0382701.1 preprotein translocase subunit SecY [Pediococcus acidilactici]KAF0456501.1 preprotein translocase subunit SecY [Pediococcus acidilactici]KAF0476023.1 preprotein translocase subunit SecY [Pediococcus acidilactici]KAF0536531.1 preprotein translocase subunit SecY [Pediococcus acidilactici]
MFSTVINALKVKDIRHKIFFTLGILIVFRLGSYITVPGVNAHALQSISSSGLVGILNTFSGGGLTNYSIFAMGVSPYITAQIIVQLLQMDIVPKFVEWSKQGEVGRRKLNQATRWLTIVLAFAQSIGITAGFNYLSQMNLVETPNVHTFLTIGLILTAGTMLTTWLGDMITERGIGQGVSMIIFAGIIARTPTGIQQIYTEQFVNMPKSQWGQSFLYVGLILLAVLAIVIFVTWVQQASRKIPIQYTRRASGASDSSYLPLKVNVAGVIPVIFASSFISTPQTILMAFASSHSEDDWYNILTNVFNMQTTDGAILYTVLIVLFTFFYAFVQVNPEKLAENLQKQGSYIPGVWPGKKTQSYVSSLLIRLSVVGALFLGLVALIPLLASNIFGLDESIGLGGTSLLIVVGVAIQLFDQLEGLMMKREYIGFIRN